MKVGFNYKFLLEAFSFMNNDVEMKFSGPHEPVYVSGKVSSLLMPVRI